MGFAFSIKAPGSSGAPLCAQWERFARLEQAPSMVALDYPPHVTLAVYDHIGKDQLRDALHRVFDGQNSILLRFVRLSRVIEELTLRRGAT